MTWLQETIDAFEKLGGQAHVQDIYNYIQRNTTRLLPKYWKSSIRREIETNSSDSEAYKKKRDIFTSVNGINKGVWKLREFENTPIAADLGDIFDKTEYPSKVKVEIYRIIRDTRIIRELKLLHNNKCQICGLSIRIKYKGVDQYYSEGHHIKPLGKDHNGPDNKENILILCANHHVEFDYLNMAIDPNTLKIMHIDHNNPYHNLDLKLMHTLDKTFLNYHYNRFVQ